GRQNSYDAGTSGTRANTSGRGGNYSGQQRIVKCFNCQEEDLGIVECPVTQLVITHNATYQVDDLDAYDSDCDEISTAKAVLMANLSSYELEVLSKIRPMLYDRNVIAKETNMISIANSEETLMLEEERRSKMLLKQNNPMVLEKKSNTKPTDYAKKLKGKDTVNNAAKMSNATTMAPGMYKVDPIILAPQVKNNRETDEYYLKHTIEQAAILREVVEEAKS
nr:hypothetical protein [Tanacetum cinerariifolium]